MKRKLKKEKPESLQSQLKHVKNLLEISKNERAKAENILDTVTQERNTYKELSSNQIKTIDELKIRLFNAEVQLATYEGYLNRVHFNDDMASPMVNKVIDGCEPPRYHDPCREGELSTVSQPRSQTVRQGLQAKQYCTADQQPDTCSPHGYRERREPEKPWIIK